MAASLTVVVADDHSIWRSGLRADLGEDFWVVAEAGTAGEAIAAIRKHKPDVAVVDLNMPEEGGIRVARECGAEVPIVILTVSEAEQDLLDAIAAGAIGYLVKSTSAHDLRGALHRAARGEPVFSPALAALVLGEFRRLSRAGKAPDVLSPREREVLQHVARGYTYREIGERLHISPKTVENHVRNILDKLHLERRAELIRYATEHGIE